MKFMALSVLMLLPSTQQLVGQTTDKSYEKEAIEDGRYTARQHIKKGYLVYHTNVDETEKYEDLLPLIEEKLAIYNIEMYNEFPTFCFNEDMFWSDIGYYSVMDSAIAGTYGKNFIKKIYKAAKKDLHQILEDSIHIPVEYCNDDIYYETEYSFTSLGPLPKMYKLLEENSPDGVVFSPIIAEHNSLKAMLKMDDTGFVRQIIFMPEYIREYVDETTLKICMDHIRNTLVGKFQLQPCTLDKKTFDFDLKIKISFAVKNK